MSLKRIRLYALTLLLPILLGGSGPQLVRAAAPQLSDSTRPLIMEQAANVVASATTGPLKPFSTAPTSALRLPSSVGGPAGPQREVFGFALASSLADPTYGYPAWNFSLLSTVAFFGLHVMDNGNFANDSGATVWNSSQLSGLLSTAHSSGTKVVLSIILQDFGAGTPHMCVGLAHAATTIAYAASEVKGKGVDGVNVDYEGLNGSCGTRDPSWARHHFTSFVAGLRSSLPTGSYLSVDSYASSAADPVGFFDIPSLAQYADSFFVMAYDLEYSNYLRAPLKCSSFCLGPTAPLAGYYYNDGSTVSQYVSVVGPSKVILGVPYYGRKSCVASGTANQFPIGAVTADTYVDATGESTATGVQAGSYSTHRDANDPAGQERWDTWVNTTLNCTRELYWDDTTSLGAKYDLVNASNLRGVGFWTLNYGGGAPELWQLIATKFGTTTSWKSLGGVLTSGPDASSWGVSRSDVFVRGGDNGLWQRTWNGTSWGSWTGLGGVLTSDPGAVSWGPNRIDVFARGTDNGLWDLYWNGTRWSAWTALGGALTAAPAAASWGAGRLDVFVRGSDNGLYHRFWNGSAWSAWEALGGTLTSSPAAVAWGPNRIDVFARGTDNALYDRYMDSSGWHAWVRLGGTLRSGPAASSCAAGHLDIFVVGTDQAVYHLGFNGTWGTWARLGGLWTSDPGAMCPSGTTNVSLFERAPDASLWATNVAGS